MKGGIGHSIFFLKGEHQHTHNGEALQIGLLEVKQSNLRVQEKEGKLHRKVTPGIQQTLMVRRTVQAKMLTLLTKTKEPQVSGQNFAGHPMLCY